ncbi:hypothetical protein JXB41_04085 [Candidatus Woesearchaeota archaeon]|nr:hypothetical protein [Candidatus Woesearchaeota archaeon]
MAFFRNPFTLSFFDSLIGPQKTHIVGMIGNAMGLQYDEMNELYAKLFIGVKIINISGFINDLWKLKNLKTDKKKQSDSTITSRKLLNRPSFKIFIATENEKLIREIYDSIISPSRVLYLGHSDFLAVVENVSSLYEIANTEDSKVDSFIETKEKYNIQIGTGFFISPQVCKCAHSFSYKGSRRTLEEQREVLMFYNVNLNFYEPVAQFKFGDEHCVLL